MPSASPLVGLGSRPAPPPPDRFAWLRSQGLGVICGYGTVLLLATGSVVMVLTREGASAGIQLDDLRPFFTRPSPVHLWLYLLFPVAGLYALNTTLATLENLRRRWRAGQRAPSAYAIAVVHLAFLLALAAHGVGGFGSQELGTVVVHGDFSPLPGFGEARLASIEVDRLPGGMPKAVRAVVELRRPGRDLEQVQVGYNQPISEGLGGRLALLQDEGRTPVARFSSGSTYCALVEGETCQVGGDAVTMLALSRIPKSHEQAALIRAPGPDGQVQERWLVRGELLLLRGARPFEFNTLMQGEPAVLLRVRETPGNPWALLAALVLSLGVALMWRRLLPRAPDAAPSPGAG